MFSRKRTRSAPIGCQLALALVVMGPALVIWGQQSQGEPLERMMEAAYAEYVAENDVIVQAELTRLRLTFLASVAGAGCWCTGILIVAHRIRRPERTEPACDAA